MDGDDKIDELLKIAKAIGYGEIPPYQHNECFTSGAFDLIVFKGSNTGRNFDLLSKLCDRYDEIKADNKFLKGYFYLLDQLAYATQTTERPSGMQRILEENPEATRELQVWYRERQC
jgi:hypothetical protein